MRNGDPTALSRNDCRYKGRFLFRKKTKRNDDGTISQSQEQSERQYPGEVIALLVGQALPLLVGLPIHQWQSQLAAKLLGPAEKAAKVLNAIFLLLVFYSQFRSLLEILLLGGMVLLLVASVAIGWLLGVALPAMDAKQWR